MSKMFRFMRYGEIDSFGPLLLFSKEADQMELIVRQLKQKTQPGEKVFTFPEHALYNFLADRPAFSRFHIAVYAHTMPIWQQELLDNLKSNPPRYIIYSTKLSNVAKNMGRTSELLPEIVKFIRDNYKADVGINQIGLYRHK